MAVPLVGENGSQLSDSRGRPLFKNVAVGSEAQLMPDAAEALKEARRTHGGLSLRQFMAGYGSTKLNDPEALWDRDLLATISSRLTVTLMLVTLFGVVAVFLAALVVDVSIRI
jgi:hypothetical protein